MNSRKSRRGGILSGLLITGLAFLCLAIAGAIYLGRNIRVTTRASQYGGDNVSIDTPAGHFSIRARDDARGLPSDVPPYPGAQMRRDSGGGASFQWESRDGKEDRGFSVSATEMITQDSPAAVLDFYRAQLPNWIVITEHGMTRLELHEGGYKRIIGIHGRYDGTHIGVASVGEPASN